MVPLLALGVLLTQQLGSPLEGAFAHNDYNHPKPLWDALACGFTHVEADVFLVDGKILVAHDLKDVKPERNLEDLYLKPLYRLHQEGKGSIYPGYKKPFWLMIDIKADGPRVYEALEKLLANYKPMLAKWTDEGPAPGAVAIVLSGNRPVDQVAKQKERWVAIDGRPANLETNPPLGLVPWISTSFADFKWPISTEPTEEQKDGLKNYIQKAHQQKRRVRFWAISDTPRFWQLQKDYGVDMINTDRLKPFRDWAKGSLPSPYP